MEHIVVYKRIFDYMVDKNDFIVLNGNSLEVLKTLEEKSIDCCVTSPPYYGLRDYGTGEWVGGDPCCNHVRDSKVGKNNITGHKSMAEKGQYVGDAIYKAVCPKCGAVRVDEQIGLEETPEEYIEKLVEVFREVKRVLKDTGTLWVNIGDSYNGSGGNHKDFHKNDTGFQGEYGTKCGGRGNYVNSLKQKDLIGIPWMLAFALRQDGWYLRSDIIWDKSGNCFPESVKDRCTKSHEYIFMLSKEPNYYFDSNSIKEPVSEVSIVRSKYGWHGKGDNGSGNYAGLGQVDTMERFVNPDGKNKRDVWHVNTQSYPGEHFATYPIELIKPCILSGCPEGGTVIDPFSGSGTTGICAVMNNRKYVGIELNKKYVDLSNERFEKTFFRKEKIIQQDRLDCFERFDFGEHLND